MVYKLCIVYHICGIVYNKHGLYKWFIEAKFENLISSWNLEKILLDSENINNSWILGMVFIPKIQKKIFFVYHKCGIVYHICGKQCTTNVVYYTTFVVYYTTYVNSSGFPILFQPFNTWKICNWKSHFTKIHEGIKYECNLWEYKAAHQVSLKKHKMSIHEGIKYKCNQCENKDSHQSNLKTHTMSIH